MWFFRQLQSAYSDRSASSGTFRFSQVAGTIISYEIVLMQLHPVSATLQQKNNTTDDSTSQVAICLWWTIPRTETMFKRKWNDYRYWSVRDLSLSLFLFSSKLKSTSCVYIALFRKTTNIKKSSDFLFVVVLFVETIVVADGRNRNISNHI